MSRSLCAARALTWAAATSALASAVGSYGLGSGVDSCARVVIDTLGAGAARPAVAPRLRAAARASARINDVIPWRAARRSLTRLGSAERRGLLRRRRAGGRHAPASPAGA